MQLTLFLGIYYYKCRQKVWIWVVRACSFRKHTETPTGGRKLVPELNTHSHTQLDMPMKSFSLSQQEPRFDVSHNRQGPRLKIKQTQPLPPLSVHLDIPATEIQLAGLHTQNLPRRDTSSWLHSTDIVVYPSIKWLNKLRQPSDIFVCHVGLLLKPFQAAFVAKTQQLCLDYI